jgi:polysaccharide transporter, PST family
MTARAAGAFRGIGWTAMGQGVTVLVSFGSMLVLSRLLTPDDFGVFAAAAPIIGFAQQLQALGTALAIVQAREVTKAQLNALFWISFSLALALAAIVALSGPWVARLMDEPRLEPVLAVGSLAVILSSLASQPQALLARGLRFRTMALRDVASAVLGTLAAIALAMAWGDHWGLVASALVMPLVAFAISALATRWWPGLPTRAAQVRPMLGFGIRIWLSNQFAFAARQADNLVIGHAESSHALGLYNRAYSLLLFPVVRIVPAFGSVAVPGLSRLVDDAEASRRLYWRTVGLLLIACHPPLLVVLFLPEAVIRLLIGPQWLEGASLFAWFAAGACAEVFAATLAWLMTSRGRGNAMVRASAVCSAVALVAFVTGIRWGIEGVAAAYVISQMAIGFPHMAWLATREGPVSLKGLAAGLLPHGLALMATALALAGWAQVAPDNLLLRVASAVAIAYAAYAAAFASIPGARRLLLSWRWSEA